MSTVKVKLCLTDKMHRIAEWIYCHHDISLSQLARAALQRRELLDLVEKESLKGYGAGFFSTTLNLPTEINDLVTSIAAKRGMSRSAVVRYVLYRHMQEYNPKAKKAQEVANG